ncbi:VOC family protein [Mycolicibacterium sp. GF69]|uniref:VOC family protein n=1 Tax=Mycolicibacterium sp. GF69 TaxID=2267251 RepID=UPI001F0B8695|nr:VOC family protein [Mycolicibacterium sp. GF69]
MQLFEQPWPEGEFRFFQLGHVVDDVLTAAAGWARAFGVGPFYVLPVVEQQADYGGEIRTVAIQVAVAQAGPVQIELIQQHCDTESIYSEWSRGGTSSFHQIATITRDYDAKTAHFAALGYPVAAQSVGGGFRVAYIDTVADFGFYTEVVEAPPAFLDQVRTISETCAAWDGSDPVRIMARDGYRVPEDSRGHPRTLKS